MARITIITDSTATIPKDLLEKYNIYVIAQTLIWGNETYKDQIDIQPTEFYQRLANTKVFPTTSQASPAEFHTVFSNFLDQGDQILAILVSEKLSGTVPSALQAKEMLPGTPIEIVDSGTVSMAMGFIILSAARAAAEGASLEECKAIAERARSQVGVLFVVDTLKFLHMGGRIGGGARFLGTALNLKPILELKDGRIEAVERVRTQRKALDRLVELLEERIGDRTPVRISVIHANAEKEAMVLLERIRTRFNSVENLFTELSPVVGAHAGPGTIGIAFMAGI